MWNTNGFPTKMIYKQWIFMDFPLLVAVVYLRVSHSCADDMRYALTCPFLLAKSLPDHMKSVLGCSHFSAHHYPPAHGDGDIWSHVRDAQGQGQGPTWTMEIATFQLETSSLGFSKTGGTLKNNVFQLGETNASWEALSAFLCGLFWVGWSFHTTAI